MQKRDRRVRRSRRAETWEKKFKESLEEKWDNEINENPWFVKFEDSFEPKWDESVEYENMASGKIAEESFRIKIMNNRLNSRVKKRP